MHMNAVAEGAANNEQRGRAKEGNEGRVQGAGAGSIGRLPGMMDMHTRQSAEGSKRRRKKKIKKYARQFSMGRPIVVAAAAVHEHAYAKWKAAREREREESKRVRARRECNCGALLVSATAVTKRRITTNCELQVSVAALPPHSPLSLLSSCSLALYVHTAR